ncbi:MAG: endo-1,4-beta-xylanase [Clostridia bacterium]|nr:endo-1,4-beta-xylanase [Clostridia bacterium]
MADRRKILELFETQKDFVKEKVDSGIERYRKGNAKIFLKDNNGKAIANAKINVKQKSHEFRFGANLFMLDELETPEKNQAYKDLFKGVFNMATLPFYWDTLEPEKGSPRYLKDSVKVYRRPPIELCLEYCNEHGIEPREHALAYEGFFPKWLYNASVEEVKSELERRYQEISSRYADKIRTIEVTNEMAWDKGRTAFYDEPDYVYWCFKLAEKYFPFNQLVINETTEHCWKDKCRPTDKYYSYIEANLLKGAKIDAIGMQYHLFYPKEKEYELTRAHLNPELIYKHMDMYSNFNKPLQITEVTIPAYSWNSEDEEIQAEMIDKLYSLWFSHPNVEQIVYWNLVDGYAHLWDATPEKIAMSQGDMTIGENYFHGGLLRFDLSPKPAYFKIQELIQKRWHTDITSLSKEDGAVEFRGFYGSYDIEVISNGKTYIKQINLSKTNQTNEFEIIL